MSGFKTFAIALSVVRGGFLRVAICYVAQFQSSEVAPDRLARVDVFDDNGGGI